MKTLAFLFCACLIFLFVGLLISEGRTPAPVAPVTLSIPPPPPPVNKTKQRSLGSAKQDASPALRAAEKSALVEALRNEDLCAAAKATQSHTASAVPAEVRGLLREFGAPTELQEMFAADGPIYGPADPKRKFTSNFLRLIFALRLGGLTEYPDLPGPVQPGSAEKILKELAAEDPGNGVYAYMLLGLYSREDGTGEKLREAAAQLAGASHFTIGITERLAEMEGNRWTSPVHSYLFRWLENPVKQILLHPGYEGFEAYAAGNPGSERLREHLGAIMTSEGNRALQPFDRNGYDWQTYQYGQTIGGSSLSASEQDERIRGYKRVYEPYINGKACQTEDYLTYYEKMRRLP